MKTQKEKLRVLFLEHAAKDIEIVHQKLLEEFNLRVTLDTAATRDDFLYYLKSKKYDVILANYALPGFNTEDALRLVIQICPDVPFIYVSRTIGEDKAVELLKKGATDYISKERLDRLPFAVSRAINEKQKEFRANEETLTLIFDSIHDGVAMFDRDGTILDINRSFAGRYEKTVKEAIGCNFKEFLPPEQYGNLFGERLKRFQRVYDTGQPESFDDARNGRRFSNRVFPIYKDGKITAVAVFSTDITNQVLAEKERKRNDVLEKETEMLRHKEEEYLQILDGSTEASWIYCFKSGGIKYSQAWLKRMGGDNVPEKDMTDYTISRIYHDDLERVIQTMTDAPKKKLSKVKTEVRINTVDGVLIWVLIQGKILYDDSGEPVKIYGTLIDITDRKKTEERIRLQNTILTTINNIYESTMNSVTMQDLADSCLKIVEHITNSNLSFIGEIGEDGLLIDVAISETAWMQCKRPTEPGCRRPVNFPIRGLLGFVIREGRSLLTNSPADHPRSAGVPEGHPPLKAFLGVPLKRDGKVFGMIGVANREGGFTQTDQEILEAIAPTILQVILHKRAEEKLRESEERFNAFMDASPCLASMKDKEGRHVYLNKTWGKIFGRKVQDALGKTNYDLYPEAVAKRVRENHFNVLASGKAVVHVEKIEKPGEEPRYWESVRFPIKSLSGKAVTGCISVDITAQKKAEEALRLSESLLRTVIEGTKDPIYLKDRNSKIIMANEGMCNAWGLSIGEILEKTALEYSRDMEKGKAILEIDKRVMGSNVTESVEIIIPSPAGSRTYLSTISPWHDAEGEVIGIIGISHDITDRKNMESQLKNQAEELEQKNQLITNFFINISHEFKTPLSILILGIELLEHNSHKPVLDKAEMMKQVRIMKQNSYRLGRLVSNLLDITKIDAGFMEPRWEKINIIDALRNLVESTDYYVKHKNLKIVFTATCEEKFMFTDSFMLERIILNLLSNAIKHTARGWIKVSCDVYEDGVAISVTDTGKGIPDNKKGIIFDRFRQVDTSLARASEGCGIGLALTKSMVELLSGRITFESTFGLGAEFVVELPLLQKEEQKYVVEQNGMHLSKRIQMEFSDINFEQ